MNKNISYHLIFLTMIISTCMACSKDEEPQKTVTDLEIRKLNVNDIKATDVPRLFADSHVEYNGVANACWPEQYPYTPKVEFAMAHNGTNLMIHYRVTEKHTLGTVTEDNGKVWEDACVEFFMSFPDDDAYYNIETNCLGFIHMALGASRYDRVFSSADNIRKIDRWASLGNAPVGDIADETSWEVALVVPVTTFWESGQHEFDDMQLKGNVYHCIGSGDHQCYLAWQRILTPAPDFHQPKFFGTIHMQE